MQQYLVLITRSTVGIPLCCEWEPARAIPIYVPN